MEHLLQEPKRSIDILLSHAHLDHVVGLTFLVDALAVTELEQIRLIGEAEKLRVVREHLYHELVVGAQQLKNGIEKRDNRLCMILEAVWKGACDTGLKFHQPSKNKRT